MQHDEWLTVPEIAERMKVNQETVRRWLRQGRLKGRNFGGKMGYRVKTTDYIAFTANDDGEESAIKSAA